MRIKILFEVLSNPEYFVRWTHLPGSTQVTWFSTAAFYQLTQPGNGSVCWNYISAAFNSPLAINNPKNNCSMHISSAVSIDFIAVLNEISF